MTPLVAFIHIAKTGGESVETLLRSNFGSRHCDALFHPPVTAGDPFAVDYVIPKYGPREFRHALRLHPGLRSIAGHPITLWSGLESVRPGVRYFCFLREPLARGASHFQFHLRNDRPCLDWERWIAWAVPRNHQAKMLSPEGRADDALRRIRSQEPFVGLTERFDESLVLLRGLFLPGLDIAYTRVNSAPDNTVARGLLADPDQREILRRMHTEDLAIHEWVANELYPGYVRAYGPGLARDVEEYRRRRDAVNRRNMLLNRLWARGIYAPLHRLLG
jgi:hypothetical protein